MPYRFSNKIIAVVGRRNQLQRNDVLHNRRWNESVGGSRMEKIENSLDNDIT